MTLQFSHLRKSLSNSGRNVGSLLRLEGPKVFGLLIKWTDLMSNTLPAKVTRIEQMLKMFSSAVHPIVESPYEV
jgi:hypothetical protein